MRIYILSAFKTSYPSFPPNYRILPFQSFQWGRGRECFHLRYLYVSQPSNWAEKWISKCGGVGFCVRKGIQNWGLDISYNP